MNIDAIENNNKVLNNYGPEKFVVFHSGCLVSIWKAWNRNHIDLLLNIEKNMGYMLSIDKVTPFKKCIAEL